MVIAKDTAKEKYVIGFYSSQTDAALVSLQPSKDGVLRQQLRSILIFVTSFVLFGFNSKWVDNQKFSESKQKENKRILY